MGVGIGALVTSIAMGGAVLVGFLVLLSLGFVILFIYWAREVGRPLPLLKRVLQNPILSPIPEHPWESEAVFNPAAIVDQGRVHLFYRALGSDGISRIGYGVSGDGVHFERLSYPVYDQNNNPRLAPPKKLSYATLTYNRDLYASGGGWGGVEDPRAVILGNHLYMSFSAFEGWDSIRITLTALPLHSLRAHNWNWKKPLYLSPRQQTNKNWVLFPEKIHGKYAILHALTPAPQIAYVDSLDTLPEPIQSNSYRSGRPGHWDAFVRGAAAPPIRTEVGWLLLYHGMNPEENIGYKVGAMILDFNDPTHILFRSASPILEPVEWYENDWKAGVVYASGAVVFQDQLFVYYGGGDKRIAVARTPMREFIRKLQNNEHIVLQSEV